LATLPPDPKGKEAGQALSRSNFHDLEDGASSPGALSDFGGDGSFAGAPLTLSSALPLAGSVCAEENELNDMLHAFQ